MSAVVSLKSHRQEIGACGESFEVYQALGSLFDGAGLGGSSGSDRSLFLLESLSGPARDCTRSVIGYRPLLCVSWTDGVLTPSGEDTLVEVVLSHFETSGARLEGRAVRFSPEKTFFEVMRGVEALFRVEGEAPGVLFGCGFFGYIGYDAIFSIEALEKTIARPPGEPEACLSLFEGIVEYDFAQSRVTLTTHTSPLFSSTPVEAVLEACRRAQTHPLPKPPVVFPYTSEAFPTVTREVYYDWVAKAKAHIALGDVYQIQFGHEIVVASDIPPFEVYRRLRAFNPSPYMYYFTAHAATVVGASPEMFAVLDGGGRIDVRPIAGTARKSEDRGENAVIERRLLADEKERAEHLMLVDLCRNDVARVCVPQSLTVDELMVTESYSHVIHIVSNVSGQLREGRDKYDVVSALFPAGTMTGTPKIRAVELIEETEKTARGLYGGCVGFFGLNNTLATALCIRTATFKEGRYTIRASGGVVEDSTPSGEWLETLNKLSSTYLAITDKELIHEDFTR